MEPDDALEEGLQPAAVAVETEAPVDEIGAPDLGSEHVDDLAAAGGSPADEEASTLDD